MVQHFIIHFHFHGGLRLVSSLLASNKNNNNNNEVYLDGHKRETYSFAKAGILASSK